MEQRIIISKNIEEETALAISQCEHDKLFVLTDTTTKEKCWPKLKGLPSMKEARMITIEATDQNKNIETTAHVWRSLSDGGATRHSCLINLGGGMVTDLGGFAASTFKRGINFINIPTTLLAMVDASVGGKTGINFNGLKNEVGVFNDSKFVIISTNFLDTLDSKNLLSGYGEMLKHGLINNLDMWRELVTFDLSKPDLAQLQRMVRDSVEVKERIVGIDPHEKGIRKALNFGHTVGHAFESWSLRHGHPILHGYAVAFGMVCELYLSCIKAGFPTERMHQTVRFIHDYYGKMEISCNDYGELVEMMTHDKKNTAGEINFTLLGNIGDIKINQTASRKEIDEAFDFFRES